MCFGKTKHGRSILTAGAGQKDAKEGSYAKIIAMINDAPVTDGMNAVLFKTGESIDEC